MRIDKFIGNNTSLSRSQIHHAIKLGKVLINGEIATKANMQIAPSDIVVLDGQTICERQACYLMLNKPKGYVSANTDSEHPTVLDLIDLPFKQELQIAGRLDIDTTGLVLLTDDGEWNHKVTSPKHDHTKTYLVETADAISDSAIQAFVDGILLHGESKKTLPATLDILSSHSARLIICEGKYHQVKRMFAAVGNRVVNLHRESIGDILLDSNLPEGKYRALTIEEVASIQNRSGEKMT